MKRLYNYSCGLSCSIKNTAITDNNKFLIDTSTDYNNCVDNKKMYGYKLQQYEQTLIIFPDNDSNNSITDQHQEEIKRVDQLNQYNILNSNT